MQRLADVVVNAATFFHGGDDRGEIVVGDNHVRRLLGDFRAAAAHRDADVRAFDGGGVVHAIAGHRDDGVVCFPRADDAQFVLGGDARIDRDFRRALAKLFVAEAVEFGGGERDVITRRNAELARNRHRGLRMIAGDHDHADAGRAAFRDGIFHLRPRRIIHAGQTDEDEIALDFLFGEFVRRSRIEIAISRAENTQRALRHRSILRVDLCAVGLVDRAHAAVAEDVRATRKKQIGRAIHKRAQTPIGQQPHDAVTFPIRIERDLVMFRQFAFELLFAPAGFMSGGKKRAFRRIAHHFPRSFLERQVRVVGADQNVRHFEQRSGVPRIEGFAFKQDFAVRPVAFARDFEGLSRNVERAHRHLADCQRAGLVRADDVGGAERLDCG